MKVDPEMYMKTNDKTTICPTQKTTFLPGCTPFYIEMPVFCGNHRRYSLNLVFGHWVGRQEAYGE
jgi:hypothetical protein